MVTALTILCVPIVIRSLFKRKRTIGNALMIQTGQENRKSGVARNVKKQFAILQLCSTSTIAMAMKTPTRTTVVSLHAQSLVNTVVSAGCVVRGIANRFLPWATYMEEANTTAPTKVIAFSATVAESLSRKTLILTPMPPVSVFVARSTRVNTRQS